MRDDLATHKVELIAISKDSVAAAARQKADDSLSFQLLSDPDLTVIKQYGLEHHKAMEFSTVRFSILGVPLALFPTVKTMAIPTSLLIDEQGVIRWIDQADDYRLRSSEDRVLAALVEAFGASEDKAAS